MPSATSFIQSGGDWIKASNDGTLIGLEGSPREIELTISEWSTTRFDDGRDQVCLSFAETDKRLGCGKSVMMELIDHLGDELDSWPGARIRLSTQRMPNGEYKGKTRMVSVSVIAKGGASAPAQRQLPATGDHLFGAAYAGAIAKKLDDLHRRHNVTIDDLKRTLVADGVLEVLIDGDVETWPKAIVPQVQSALAKLEQGAPLTQDDIPF